MDDDFPLSPEDVARAVRISQVPLLYRTAEETKLQTRVLSHFDFFKKKVSASNLSETLYAAAENLKYIRVPPGKFLFHTSNFTTFNIIFIITRSSPRLYVSDFDWWSMGI